ncbi:MAG TPA: ABC transporter permease, partial [Bryobacteraceae bacterium]|nr:ABC transporter permease [Bryobacteraceae bacterium]
MKRSLKRLRALWRRRQLDRDLDEELAFHLAMQVEEGAAPSAAQRQFGNAAALKESSRELWTFTTLETWWQDLRYAVRTLGKNPTVTWVAIVALALGIGADTTMFTVISCALSFNMGVDHIERLVIVTPGGGLQRSPFRQVFPEFADLRARIKSITHLAAYRMTHVNVSNSGAFPEVYSAVQMTASGWGVINRKPVLGRVFTSEDERPDASLGLLLSHRVWRNRYGEDPAILGKVVRVNEVPHTVIGVMSPGSQFPEDADMWTLLTLRDLLPGPGQVNAMVFGRLADGVTLTAARSEVDMVARSLTAEYPQRFQGLIVELRPFLEIIGIYAARVILIAVLCAVTFVLLIVCADVATLLLARAAARAREISIRIAIGAGRARIIRQLLVESTLLATGGGLGGWLVALAGLRWFDHVTSTARLPSWMDFTMNTRAFVYLAAISIGAGILFGLAPALQLARVDVNSGIKEGGRGAEGGMRSRRLSSLLVAFQMALCVVLLAGAGLMIHSSVKLYNAPIALNPANVLTMRISLPETKYPGRQDRLGFYRQLKAKLAALPGVQVVSLTSNPPLTGSMTFRGELEGAAASDPNHALPFGAVLVDADYFRTLQIRLRRGRVFTEQDGLAGPGVVIVNESFAAKYWPGQDPLGKRLRRVDAPGPQPWLTIVGLAPDNPHNFQHPLER